MPRREPNWQPLSLLPLFVRVIDGMTDCAEEQLLNLQRAEAQPQLLDNTTIDRLIGVYSEQKDELWLYEEQLSRWKKQSPTAAQGAEITRLEQRLSRLGVVIDELLARVQRLRTSTIEAVLAKSEPELGLDVLTSRRPPPTAPCARPMKPSQGDDA